MCCINPPFYVFSKTTNIFLCNIFFNLRLLTCLATYLLTPWRRILLEKLTGLQLVKKFPTFYGTWRFITTFTSARHLSLSWASSIQSIPRHTTSWRSILILSSHTPWFPQRPPSSRIPHQNPVHALPLIHCLIVFPFFLKYMVNAEYMISSWPLRQNLHWWSLIISSAYGVNIESRMLG